MQAIRSDAELLDEGTDDGGGTPGAEVFVEIESADVVGMPDDEELQGGVFLKKFCDFGKSRLGFGFDVGFVELEQDAVERDSALLADLGFHGGGINKNHALLHSFGLDEIHPDQGGVGFDEVLEGAGETVVGETESGDGGVGVAIRIGTTCGDVRGAAGCGILEELSAIDGLAQFGVVTEVGVDFLFADGAVKDLPAAAVEFVEVVAMDFEDLALAVWDDVCEAGEVSFDLLAFIVFFGVGTGGRLPFAQGDEVAGIAFGFVGENDGAFVAFQVRRITWIGGHLSVSLSQHQADQGDDGEMSRNHSDGGNEPKDTRKFEFSRRTMRTFGREVAG